MRQVCQYDPALAVLSLKELSGAFIPKTGSLLIDLPHTMHFSAEANPQEGDDCSSVVFLPLIVKPPKVNNHLPTSANLFTHSWRMVEGPGIGASLNINLRKKA